MNKMSTFKYLIDVLSYEIYSEEILLLEELKKLNINLEKSLLYFKGLFVDNNDKILYVFTDAKFYILSINKNEENTLDVQVLNINEIKDIKYSKDYSNKNKLQLSFSINNNVIKFNPNIDTSKWHIYNYNEIVQDIINKLIN